MIVPTGTELCLGSGTALGSKADLQLTFLMLPSGTKAEPSLLVMALRLAAHQL